MIMRTGFSVWSTADKDILECPDDTARKPCFCGENRGMSAEFRNLVCLAGRLSENQTRIEARGIVSRLRLRFSVRGFDCFRERQLIVSPNSPGGDFGEVFEGSMEYFAQVTKRMVAGGLSPLAQHACRFLQSGLVWGVKVTKRAPNRQTSRNRHIQGGFCASFKSCRGHHQIKTPLLPRISGCASVAQLDRASDFGSEGCRFKSCRMHHLL